MPLLITPHPLNDLTPEEVRELARAAYPIVTRQLTGQGAQEKETRASFVHPATRKAGAGQRTEAV
ncbi:MAG TPA: hypothetical protein VLN59_03690 [Burkholderiales bacterium]|nr:hypothetical protein [Burkholderiales bacterium]